MPLEHVRDHTPELQGDRVARMEVDGRVMELQGRIEAEFGQALSGARWRRRGHRVAQLDHTQLNSLASDLADKRFALAPHLHNELLNRGQALEQCRCGPECPTLPDGVERGRRAPRH